MSLNIKSPEAHELAAQLARLTGESMTKAVTEAIRERLERKRRDRDRGEAGRRANGDRRQRGARIRARIERSHGEFLYDERGLPR